MTTPITNLIRPGWRWRYVPPTQIAGEVGTSVRIIELHYTGVIANWDGKRTR